MSNCGEHLVVTWMFEYKLLKNSYTKLEMYPIMPCFIFPWKGKWFYSSRSCFGHAELNGNFNKNKNKKKEPLSLCSLFPPSSIPKKKTITVIYLISIEVMILKSDAPFICLTRNKISNSHKNSLKIRTKISSFTKMALRICTNSFKFKSHAYKTTTVLFLLAFCSFFLLFTIIAWQSIGSTSLKQLHVKVVGENPLRK